MSSAPDHALRIWVSNETLFLELPSDKGYSHTLKFPLSEGGLSALANVLRERERHLAKPRSFNAIATPALPIQYVVDQMVKGKMERARKLNSSSIDDFLDLNFGD